MEDLEKEIAEIRKIVESNQKILRKLQAHARWAHVLGVLKWVIYIGIITGTYLLIRPFLDQFMATYQAIQDNASVLSDLKNSLPSMPSGTDGSGFNFWDLLKKSGQ